MTESNNTYTYGKFILAGGVVIFALGQSLLFIIVAPLARTIGLTETQFGLVFSLANLSLVFAAPFFREWAHMMGAVEGAVLFGHCFFHVGRSGVGRAGEARLAWLELGVIVDHPSPRAEHLDGGPERLEALLELCAPWYEKLYEHAIRANAQGAGN